MIVTMLDALFGCLHDRLSFPMTVRYPKNIKIKAARLTGTYVVCLDCGKEFAYDWHTMQTVSDAAAERVLEREVEA